VNASQPSLSIPQARALHFFEKVRVCTGCAIAAALFVTVGWTIARPVDPQMPLTFALSGGGGPTVAMTIALLAAVAAAVATVVASRTMHHAGVVAVAIGLAVMTTRGGTMLELLMYYGVGQTERRRLAMALLIDLALWAGAMACAWLSEQLVQRWIGSASPSPDDVVNTTSHPDRGAKGKDASAPSGLLLRHGFLGAGIAAVVAWIVISLTITRTPASVVQRGQVYFALALGCGLGAVAGTQLWPRGRAVWYALSVLVLAMIAYAWMYARPLLDVGEGYYAQLATTPPNPLVRALPVEFMSVGVAGALVGYWFGLRIYRNRHTGDQTG
jgi:hypothetical protein